MFKPLRDKILELAITGKLVPQLDNEPAVEQIGPAPAEDEVPFALPEKWKWVRLGGLIRYISGTAYQKNDVSKSSNNSIRILRGGNIGKYGEIFLQDDDVFVTKELQDNFCRVCAGDVVIVASTGSATAIGRAGCATIDFDAQIGAFLRIIRTIQLDVLEPKYLHAFFLSSVYKQNIQSVVQGTNIKNVKRAYIDNMLLPLPPLEEQRRIVAKLDDIMGNLERMDQAYTELSGPMVKHFKNLVLQQAISGQLVPQLDREPAVEQVGPAPADDEVPFALPEKWKWVQLGVLLPFGISQQVQPTQIPDNAWVLGLEDIESNGDLLLKRYNSPRVDSSKNSFKAGDVLYSKMRPYLNKVIIADEAGFCSTELLVLDVQKAISPLLAQYLLSFLRSSYFVEYATLYSHGQKPRLDLRAGRCAWFPLPPLEEQRRIVARIEELFGDVDKLLEWQQFA